jgi:glycosyltransferase involved in cell wall biosynthesis
MISRKKMLIFYDWFYPGFKAGGPIQSLTNLAVALTPNFDIYVITGACDLNSETPYDNINVNSWNTVQLNENAVPITVFYASKKTLNKQKVGSLIREVSPSVVYLNGIFSYRYFMLPLLALKAFKSDIKVVVCPRGMLKKGALSGKAFKKKIYISYLRFSRLPNRVHWHATSAAELVDITSHFPINQGVSVADNIPKKPVAQFLPIFKVAGELRLVYLSLINEHKKLLLLLQAINEIDDKISLDIYGPVVDFAYWQKCEELIKQMTGKVQYKGVVEPAKVQRLIENYHAFILFTKGENFGHALFESLSVGRPVITSHFTPWQSLYEKHAGANVDLNSTDDCIDKMTVFLKMTQEEYNIFCSGAHVLAKNYYNNLETGQRYKQLF